MMFIIREVIVYNNNKKGGVNLGDIPEQGEVGVYTIPNTFFSLYGLIETVKILLKLGQNFQRVGWGVGNFPQMFPFFVNQKLRAPATLTPGRVAKSQFFYTEQNFQTK